MSLKKHGVYLVIAAIFVISRVIFYCLGVRFDDTALFDYIQVIDPVLLKNNLLQSLLFLHVQPPFFNLFLGIVLKIFPQHHVFALQIIYLLAGFIFHVTLFALMLRLGVNKKIALILTVVFMLNPATILYENWPYISYLTAVWLCAAAFFLNKYLHTHETIHGLSFCGLLTVLLLTRPTFHLLWFVLIALVIVGYDKQFRKTFIKLAIIPVLFCLLLYGKNFALTGMLTSSSLLGYYMLKMVLPGLTLEQAQALADTGQISKATFREIDFLEHIGRDTYQNEVLPETGVAVMDEYYKSTGASNFNSMYHLKTYKRYLAEGKVLLRLYPGNYLKQLRQAYFVYFFPGPTDVPFKNRKVLETYENFYNFMFAHLNSINNGELYTDYLWGPMDVEKMKMDGPARFLYGLVVFFYGAVFFFGCVKACALIRRPSSGPLFVTLVFILFNIFYLTAVSNALANYAVNRYRFDIDPFYYCLLGMMATDFLRLYSKKKRRNSSHGKH